MGLLDDAISLPASAYGAEPLTVAEIDAHPDCARIWALIRELREEHDTVCVGYETRLGDASRVAYDEGFRDGSDAEC